MIEGEEFAFIAAVTSSHAGSLLVNVFNLVGDLPHPASEIPLGCVLDKVASHSDVAGKA
jgi:hypothetical protein